MNDEDALLSLVDDLEQNAAKWQALGWQIDPWPLTSCVFYVSMTALDEERYTLQIRADRYPLEAPDVIPIDPATRSSALLSAWPQCNGFRPPNDLCLQYTRTGYALHPEWRNNLSSAWLPNSSSIMLTLECIHGRLNDPSYYSGRCR